jgi:hypothetical protein
LQLILGTPGVGYCAGAMVTMLASGKISYCKLRPALLAEGSPMMSQLQLLQLLRRSHVIGACATSKPFSLAACRVSLAFGRVLVL